jgi:flagellar motor switch/type III secretory pathway protein FliN
MSTATAPSMDAASFRFNGLPTYRREEVAVWNWCHRFLGCGADWKTWIQDAWHELLQVPAGFEVTLCCNNSVDAQAQPWTGVFKQRDIFIGREPDNDVILPTLTVGKRHARISIENGRCLLEDLGSSVGTYLNQNRITPNQSQVVQPGDQIAIFPYTFSLKVRRLWAPEVNIGIYSAVSESMTWGEFLEFAPRGRTTFEIQVHPTKGALCLEANRAFLSDLVERLLRPLELQEPRSVLGAADSGLLEFVILALLERINRDLTFPIHFDTGVCGSKPALPADTKGAVLVCSLGLLATIGAVRVFAPYEVLRQMASGFPPVGHRGGLPSSVAWEFPVSAGSQVMTIQETAELECDDVLLFQPKLELLMPGRFHCGWRVRDADFEENANALSNIQRIEIDNYFEREVLTSGDPNLNQLPLQVHVIVAEKQLTLAEANGLAPGTIVELDRSNSGHVLLAVNGKVLGEGQLVDVEGRLGVRILAWRGA